MWRYLTISVIICLTNLQVFGQLQAHAGIDDSICSGSSITLGGSPAATPPGTYTFHWSSQSGFVSVLENPNLIPGSSSYFYLSVTSLTDTAYDTVLINVFPLPPVPTIIANGPTTFCQGSSVLLQASPFNGFLIQWFLNGVPIIGANSYLFNAVNGGNYTVSITKTYGSRGCTKGSSNFPVVVYPTPIPDLVDYNLGADFINCNGQSYTLDVHDNTIGTSNNYYEIDWGDGSPHSIHSPTFTLPTTHTYAPNLIYQLFYTVKNSYGCQSTIHKSFFNITNPAVGVNSLGNTSGCDTGTFCFPISSYGSNHISTVYLVYYGDGNMDTFSHPPPDTICYTYTTTSCGMPGNTFTFRITAWNACDSTPATVSNIKILRSPDANFTMSPNPGCVNQPVTFNNTTIPGYNLPNCNKNTSFTWHFGDGITQSYPTTTNPSSASPQHTYSQPGIYYVTLLATNITCGADSIIKPICIQSPPMASFTGNPTDTCTPFTVNFMNSSNTLITCGNTTYTWTISYVPSICVPSTSNFQYLSGTNQYSINPVIKFINPGTYTVKLTLQNACGSSFFNKTFIVKTPPQVIFNSIPNYCGSATFTPTATIKSCLGTLTNTPNWSFSGGNPSTYSGTTPPSVLFTGIGIHTITLSATNECGTTIVNQNFEIKPLPVVTVGSSLIKCISDSPFNLTGALPSGGTWSGTGITNATLGTFNPSVSGTGTFTITYNYTSPTTNCTNTATLTITVNALPPVDAGSNQTMCINDPAITLTGNIPSGGTWSGTGITNSSGIFNPAISGPGAFILTYSYIDPLTSCSKSDTKTITVNALPIVNAQNDTTICNQIIPIILHASPTGGTWSGNGINPTTGAFTPSGTGIFKFYYNYTGPTSCYNLDSVTVTIINPTPANAGSSLAVCIGSSQITLSATPGGGTWSGSSFIIQPNKFNPTQAGNYILTYTFGAGNCLTTDTMTIKVNPLPIVEAGNNQSLCINDPALTISGFLPTGGTWSGTGITNSFGVFNPAISGPGVFTLTYSYTDPLTGCSKSDTKTITVNALPIVTAQNDTTICNQTIPIILHASPIGGIWSGNGINPTTGSFTPASTGTFKFYYNYTGPTTCHNLDSVIVSVINPMPANAGNSMAVCMGSSQITLSATPVGGTWSGSTFIVQPNKFNPTTAGNYILMYTFGAGNCLTTDTMTIRVNSLPSVEAGNNLSLCIDDPAITFSGFTPSGGTWSGTGITNSSGVFNPSISGAGTFTLTYSYTDPLTGCSKSDTKTITVNALPIVNAQNDTTICNQTIPIILHASPFGGIWSGNGINPTSGAFTPSSTGTFKFYYNYTGPTTCHNLDSVTVTVINPTPANAGNSLAVCIGSSQITLSATPGGGTWSGSTFLVQPNKFNPTQAGNYILTYTFGAGNCLTTDTMTIKVNPLPIVEAGNSQSLCIDDPALAILGFLPTGGTWSGTGITNSSGVFNPTISGAGEFTLIYSYTDPLTGCSKSDTKTITVNALPIVNAQNDTTICNQTIPIILHASPTGGTWSGNGINTTSGSYTPSGTGIYKFLYNYTLSTTGCHNLDSVLVTIVNPTLAYAGTDTSVCLGSNQLTLASNPNGGVWSGSTLIVPPNKFNPNTAGTYNLTYSFGAGNCLTKDYKTIIVNPLPIVEAGGNQSKCVDDPLFTLAGNSPSGGTWSGVGITNPNTGLFNPSTAGVGISTITYTYINPTTTCTNLDSKTITINPLPIASFIVDTTVCITSSVIFNNTSSGSSSYIWKFGDGNISTTINPTHYFQNQGDYSVSLIAISTYGCDDTVQKIIHIFTLPTINLSVNPDEGCAPLTVSYTNSSVGYQIQYLWNFGNGSSSSLQSPNPMTYMQGLQDTTYYISLMGTNECGLISKTDSIIIHPNPEVDFGLYPNWGCSPLPVTIMSNVNGLPNNIIWDLGDGSASFSTSQFNQPFIHTYTTGSEISIYHVKLIAINDCGSDTLIQEITVNPNNVNVFFMPDTSLGCVPLTVNFSNYSLGCTIYNWDFGDGNTSNLENPTHTFLTPGVYSISLAGNNNCSYDTINHPITVIQQPTVDFTFSDSICNSDSVHFLTTVAGLSNTSWDFGDGTNSSLTNPTHKYSSAGSYTVTMTGTAQATGCLNSKTKLIYIKFTPTASFTHNPNEGCSPLSVNFQNNSMSDTLYANYYIWQFGNGNTSSQTNPIMIFTNTDPCNSLTYTIHLQTTSFGCSDSISSVIKVYPNPFADFSTTDNVFCFFAPPDTVNFNNLSDCTSNYNWDFGNGNTSQLNNPLTIYNVAGPYDVELIVANQFNCKDTVSKTINIYPKPFTNIELDGNRGCQPLEVTFNHVYNSIFHHWNFGDGTFSNNQNPTHIYENFGTYTVKLGIKGIGECSDSIQLTDTVHVYPKPIADFSYQYVSPDPNTGEIQFSNSRIYGDYYSWNFDDGTSSNLFEPFHRYRYPGLYQTELTSTNAYGCIDVVVKEVKIDDMFGLFIPNAFAPDNPKYEVNIFKPAGVGIRTYWIQIFDTWGNVIWESTVLDQGRPTEFWDGNFKGKPAQTDVYIWKADAIFQNGLPWAGMKDENGVYRKTGPVILIR